MAFALGGAAALAISLMAILLQPSPTPASAAIGVCNTFDQPGANVFEVPAGVTSIEAAVFGAQGGDVVPTSDPQFGAGGLGGGATP